MPTFSPIRRLIVATHNPGKLGEFRNLLAPYVGEVISAGDLALPEPEETGTTFAENALLKARAAATAAQAVALADDSGLCIKALGGAPGIYSARWAGAERNFSAAMRRVHEELAGASDHAAYFMCVLALVWPDGHEDIIEGRVDGQIVWPPRGDKGHGYDPLFVPLGATRSFAEMEEAEKNAISHRGRAVRRLIEKLSG